MLFHSRSSATIFMNAIRQLTTKTRVKGMLQEKILEAFETNHLNPKRHPGRIKPASIDIPNNLHKAVLTVLKDQPLPALLEEGEKLNRYLKGRHMPMNDEEFKILQQANPEKRLRQYNWKPIEYDAHTSLQYLVARVAPEFAILNKVFAELTTRLPNFKPQTLFDFGSGVGSVAWVAHSLWGQSLKEIYCVDTSRDMLDLAELLLKGGDSDGDLPLPGTYFRQFLPASQSRQYDVVISAFSLFELDSTQSRLQTLHNLWGKTRHYLVLIEQGTHAAFKLMDEAKEFITYLSKSQGEAHILAPCPHEEACPRMQAQDGTPCNFEVRYPPYLKRSGNYVSERYSYVIIGKGRRPETVPAWPRIVRPTIVRRRHTICRLCTSKATLQEIIFTPAKSGKATYQCARSSEWGDVLPIDIEESLVSTNSVVGAEESTSDDEAKKE